ncbi:hypothetical protein OGM63_10190 [Plectonema radiosum NIES-515]|uniref:Curli production assembly/transport component CsgF n=1 Tax=Plectonema radiosum NIES-515 TaxID=2986073 RepID=A0ABT3AXM5_9CYAN|nr:hypothetical protein [Plectonema radiosum]MCV3213877.1 hypothetical protein [Plectonema radiosum NIES-515]
MNSKVIAALAIIASVTSLGNSVNAQSPSTQNSNVLQYMFSGDSLSGINNRTAQDDYAKFFAPSNSANAPGNNTQKIVPMGILQIGDQLELRRLDEPLTLTDTPIILQPDQSDNSVNDGVQVQLFSQ